MRCMPQPNTRRPQRATASSLLSRYNAIATRPCLLSTSPAQLAQVHAAGHAETCHAADEPRRLRTRAQRAQALCVLVPPAASPPTANASPDGAPDAGAPAAPADLSAAADLFAAADADCEPSAFVLEAGGAAGGSPAAADVLAAALGEAEEPPGGTTVAVRAAGIGGAAAGAPPDAGGAQP